MHPASTRFLEAVLDLLWAHWTAVGVAGVGASQASLVDPEALVLATADFGRFDARLFDEVLDWLVTNAARVDLVRLKRSIASASDETPRVAAAMADLVAAHSGRRQWRTLVESPDTAPDPPATRPAIPLFQSGHGGSGWGEQDPVFLAHGFARGPLVLRGMSEAPDASLPACARFRARGLTGIGARAEVLTYLWTHEWSHGRLIAQRSLYAKTAVAQYLSDLAQLRLAARRETGRQVLYRLEPSLTAVGTPIAPYVDWAAAFRGLALLWHRLQMWPTATGDVGHAEASGLVQALVKAAPDLAAEGFDYHLPEMRGWANRGIEVPLEVVEDITRRIEELAR